MFYRGSYIIYLIIWSQLKMDILNSIRGPFISSSTLIQAAFKQVLMSMSTTYMQPYAYLK